MSDSRRAPETLDPELPVSSGEPLVFPIGEVVDETYEIRGLLGAGGMGQVYEAYDRELGRRVAIKVTLPGTAPESLRIEGRALAAIQHPSVVAVHARGIHRGADYLVLERVPGMSLQKYMEKRRERGEPFSIAEALDLLIRVVEGLTVVHGAGLTHRDVKPGNIMLAPGNRVVLMDFGLILPQIDASEHERVVGSLDYMAPEALLGNVARETGPLLDIYAVGIMAFEMLTGFAPYNAQTPGEHLIKQMNRPVPEVSTHRASTPHELAKLIRELMAPGVADRPHSAEAVLWRLRSIREREQTASSDEPFGVLIVDDDLDMHRTLAAYVEVVFPEAEIAATTTGGQAIRMVRKKAPNLLFLDLDLPDVNGIEVCMILRGMNVTDRCKIVAVSGRATDADASLLNQFGVSLIRKGPSLMQEMLLLLDTISPVGRVTAG